MAKPTGKHPQTPDFWNHNPIHRAKNKMAYRDAQGPEFKIRHEERLKSEKVILLTKREK